MPKMKDTDRASFYMERSTLKNTPSVPVMGAFKNGTALLLSLGATSAGIDGSYLLEQASLVPPAARFGIGKADYFQLQCPHP